MIYNRDLLNCPLEELKEELREQGVVEIVRVTAIKNDIKVETGLHILTFAKATLPLKVTAAMHSLDVRRYIPNPLQCYRCYQFAHPATRCTADPKCGRCGAAKHDDSCNAAPMCLNCKGSHPAYFKKCPAYIKEAKITTLQATENLTYREAKGRLYSANTNQETNSYAKVTATGQNTATPLLQMQALSTMVEAVLSKIEPIITAAVNKMLEPIIHQLGIQIPQTQQHGKQAGTFNTDLAGKRKAITSPEQSPVDEATFRGFSEDEIPISQLKAPQWKKTANKKKTKVVMDKPRDTTAKTITLTH